jgi:hypothetical protein
MTLWELRFISNSGCASASDGHAGVAYQRHCERTEAMPFFFF